jgi:hypothetical protein
MPSFGGEVKYVSHVPALRHVKYHSNLSKLRVASKIDSLVLVPSFANRGLSRHLVWSASGVE